MLIMWTICRTRSNEHYPKVHTSKSWQYDKKGKANETKREYKSHTIHAPRNYLLKLSLLLAWNVYLRIKLRNIPTKVCNIRSRVSHFAAMIWGRKIRLVMLLPLSVIILVTAFGAWMFLSKLSQFDLPRLHKISLSWKLDPLGSSISQGIAFFWVIQFSM